MTSKPQGITGLFIRPAIQADTPVIHAFIKDLATFEHLSHEVTATEADLRQWLFGVDPAARAVVAAVEGRTVGYAIYFRHFSTFLGKPGIYVEDLFVQEHLRSRGIGRRMLVYLAREAVEQGYGRMEWSALNWNQRAIALYLRVGAVPEEGWTAYRLTGASLLGLANEPADLGDTPGPGAS